MVLSLVSLPHANEGNVCHSVRGGEVVYMPGSRSLPRGRLCLVPCPFLESGVGMPDGYTRGWVCTPTRPSVPTPTCMGLGYPSEHSTGHHNTNGSQAGCMHPVEILSCRLYLYCSVFGLVNIIISAVDIVRLILLLVAACILSVGFAKWCNEVADVNTGT